MVPRSVQYESEVLAPTSQWRRCASIARRSVRCPHCLWAEKL